MRGLRSSVDLDTEAKGEAMTVVTDEMVRAACAAQDGPNWEAFNASLVWPVRAGLEAALAVVPDAGE